MKKTPHQQQTDIEAADERLRPIRLWAHANHGTVKSIAEKLTAMTGRPVMRQTVGRWIHKDPAKRQQPTYGFGILLERAIQELQAEAAERQEAEWKESCQVATAKMDKPAKKAPAKKAAKATAKAK